MSVMRVQDGSAVYFGDRSDAITKATAGEYQALNISDFTADGWIKASVPSLSTLDSLPAYSLIAAPDFFPAVDQREVYEWWLSIQDQSALSSQPIWLQQLVQEGFWNFWRAQPIPLSDERSAPNIIPGEFWL